MVIKKKAARSANQRKTAKLKPADGTLGMKVIHPYAAGIDVGNGEHYVAVPPMLDKDSVRVFGCFTSDLIAMATWLSEIGVTTVALQSTGVYWIPLYDVLTQRGSRCSWSTQGRQDTCPGGRRMCWSANGS
jgi:hypothetical protein